MAENLPECERTSLADHAPGIRLNQTPDRIQQRSHARTSASFSSSDSAYWGMSGKAVILGA